MTTAFRVTHALIAIGVRRIHRSWRAAHGRTWVALVIAMSASTACFVTGCRPKAGAGEACGWGTGCADGLVCGASSGVCGDIVSPMPYCEPESTGCSESQVAYQCTGGAVPSDPYLTQCAVAQRGDTVGDALYCCTDLPHCVNFGPCGSGAVNIQCNDPIAPQSLDSTYVCATLYSEDGWSSYCCAHESACFAANLFGCGDAGQSYACTGNASPDQSGLTCGPGDYQDAGTSGTYCCATDAGGD